MWLHSVKKQLTAQLATELPRKATVLSPQRPFLHRPVTSTTFLHSFCFAATLLRPRLQHWVELLHLSPTRSAMSRRWPAAHQASRAPKPRCSCHQWMRHERSCLGGASIEQPRQMRAMRQTRFFSGVWSWEKLPEGPRFVARCTARATVTSPGTKHRKGLENIVRKSEVPNTANRLDIHHVHCCAVGIFCHPETQTQQCCSFSTFQERAQTYERESTSAGATQNHVPPPSMQVSRWCGRWEVLDKHCPHSLTEKTLRLRKSSASHARTTCLALLCAYVRFFRRRF